MILPKIQIYLKIQENLLHLIKNNSKTIYYSIFIKASTSFDILNSSKTPKLWSMFIHIQTNHQFEWQTNLGHLGGRAMFL